jgi:hypothetical protein
VEYCQPRGIPDQYTVFSVVGGRVTAVVPPVEAAAGVVVAGIVVVVLGVVIG